MHTSHALAPRFLVTAALLALGGLACTTPPPDPLEPAARVLSFTASKTTVPRGATVTLSWKAENVSTLTLAEARKGAVAGASGAEGTLEVPVDDDSLYVLTVANARGAVDRAVVAVRLEETAHDVLFTATPSAIDPGQPVVLAWSAPGARAVTLTDDAGHAADLGGQLAAGSVTVNPTATTTWTLKADTREAKATATVRPSLVAFTASPLAAAAGGKVTLAWQTTGATKVELRAPNRAALVSEIDAAKVAQGSFEDTLPAVVDPGQLFPYTLVVTAGATELRRDVVVAVAGNPAVETFTAPVSARLGKTFTLSWTTREATLVTLAADGVVFYRSPTAAEAAANSLVLPTPTKNVQYTLTALGARGGQATKQVTLDVVGVPTIALTTSPGALNGGDELTLTWAGTSVRQLTLSSDREGVLYVGSGVIDTGTFKHLVNTSATLKAVADNGFGETGTATAVITVQNPLELVPSVTGSLRAGQPVDLMYSWDAGTAEIVGLAHGVVTTHSADAGFDDISLTGARLPFTAGADDEALTADAGFVTTLFGTSVGPSVTVTTNGLLSFSAKANGLNYTNVALPTAKLEAYTLAPLWDDLALGSGGVFWQVKDVGAERVLVVQWDKVGTGTALSTFQVKVHSTGQVDFEYLTVGSGLSANCGVQGPRPTWGVALASTPVSGDGVTFFGPRPAPVTVQPVVESRYSGLVQTAKGAVRVTVDFNSVVQAGELHVSEALVKPATAVGAAGQWLELRNGKGAPIDLANWSLTLPDGGSLALQGTLPSKGLLLIGSTTDRALTDDAGVTFASADFGWDGDAGTGTVSVGRTAPTSTWSWSSPGQGIATVNDVGPFMLSSDLSTTLPHGQTCTAPTTSTFGGQTPAQRGTPGVDQGCGFGYGLQEIEPGYFDISKTGTAGVTGSFDSSTFTLSLASAPFPFFGTAQSSAFVSTNGLLSFDATATTSYSTSVYPSTSAPNSALVVMAADLTVSSLFADGQIYWKRVVANEDPFAAAPHWIVQWHHYSGYASPAKDDLNFQAKLFDDGTIEYHYANLVSGSSTHYGSGLSTTSWLENPTGTQALVIAARSASPGLSPNRAFRFYRR